MLQDVLLEKIRVIAKSILRGYDNPNVAYYGAKEIYELLGGTVDEDEY